MRLGVEGLTILTVPYYQIWHRPSDFLEQIKRKLILSDQYPKLGTAGITD
jgi:hypothetical protein